eukprot:Nk52_evm3s292 gene=Nk52_evmTU3s292
MTKIKTMGEVKVDQAMSKSSGSKEESSTAPFPVRKPPAQYSGDGSLSEEIFGKVKGAKGKDAEEKEEEKDERLKTGEAEINMMMDVDLQEEMDCLASQLSSPGDVTPRDDSSSFYEEGSEEDNYMNEIGTTGDNGLHRSYIGKKRFMESNGMEFSLRGENVNNGAEVGVGEESSRMGTLSSIRENENCKVGVSSVLDSPSCSSDSTQLHIPVQKRRRHFSIETEDKKGSNRSDDENSSVELPFKGFCGLMNLGNTCYMNSGIQCLCRIDGFVDFFNSGAYLKDINEENSLGMGGLLVRKFAEVCDALTCQKWSVVNPKMFKQSLGMFAPQFKGYGQQDAQEFLAFLLDGMNEDLKRKTLMREVTEMEVDNTKDEGEAKDRTVPLSFEKLKPSSFVEEMFVGTFRNTLMCSVCSKVSFKTDPFMSLSLPIPGAHLFFIEIVLVYSRASAPPSRFLLKLRKGALCGELREQLSHRSGIALNCLILIDIFGKFVFTPLVDSSPVREPKDDSSSNAFGTKSTINSSRIFAFEVTDDARKNFADPTSSLLSCSICLEEFENHQLFTHTESECDSTFCWPCLEAFGEHSNTPVQEGEMPCPTCNTAFPRSSFNTLCGEKSSSEPDNNSILALPVLNRLNKDSAEDKKTSNQVFGNVHMACVPAQGMSSKSFLDILKTMAKDMVHPSFASQINLVTFSFVKLDGTVCGRCPFSSNCTGCNVESGDEPIGISPKDRIAINWPTKDFYNQELNEFSKHSSYSEVNGEKSKLQSLHVTECFGDFTSLENLTDENQWFCPRCEQRQPSTKQIDILNMPPVLIIHLKRFVNEGMNRFKVSSFVEFPIEGLDLSDFVLRDESSDNSVDEKYVYDLQAVSYQMGTLNGGHYVASGRLGNGKWCKFNDSSVTYISEEDVVLPSAYLLFYTKRR